MNNKKYKLSNITMKFEGRTLHRVIALKDFADVRKGELGGWVSSENNLSQYGNCWVYNNAMCMDNSRMYDNSRMCNNSILKGNDKLYGKLVSRVEEFIEINNKKGRIVTGVLKDGKILYNIGCQSEITKEVFVDRIYNEDGGIKKHPYRKEYLKIIDVIESYLSK